MVFPPLINRALKAPAARREETAMVTIRGWLYRQVSTVYV